MKYWLGGKNSIDTANTAAFDKYIGENPVAIDADGNEVPNPTNRWAEPLQDKNGQWFIPAYDGISTPAGCSEVDDIEIVTE